jgi:putative membrane protein
MSKKQKDKTLFVSTIILVYLHLSGYIGIHSPLHNLFLQLTPINLLVSTFLLFLNQKQFNRALYIFCSTVFMLSFMIEVAGVKSGIIFGDYNYNHADRFKLFNVPIIIGVNWVMLIFIAGCIFNNLQTNIVIKSLAGAGLLVILDYFIEPVAIKYGFWAWKNDIVPFQNYVAWFVFSFLFLLLFHISNFNKDNKFARALFIVQLIFFILLGRIY